MTTAPYLLTASGQRYRLTGPELDTPRIGDIAHHLAQINRFTGAASRPYSVAEHSLLCEQIAASEGAGPMARLCALMHDAHEAYCSDMASPAKVAMCILGATANGYANSGLSDYSEFEGLHADHVRESFDLSTAFKRHSFDIRRWDLIALATERAALMPQDDGEGWAILDGVAPWSGNFGLWGDLNSHQRCGARWDVWRELFFEKYRGLLALTVTTGDSHAD